LVLKTPLRPHQERMIRELVRPDAVRVKVGRKWSDVLLEYRAADVFVLPSLMEGFPRVLYEAMSQGVPVIATSVGGIPDIVKDRDNGLLVVPGSPDRLAEAIRTALVDDELRAKIVTNGYETVEKLLRKRPFSTHADQVAAFWMARLEAEKH